MDISYQPKQPSSSPPNGWKPTLPFLALSGLLFLAYFSSTSDTLALNYKALENFEFWRLITSSFSSFGRDDLISNLFAAIMLTLVSERLKGSVGHCLDLAIKTFLINLVSLLFYIIVLSCAILYNGVFADLRLLQDDAPGAGLKFLLICELFLLLSESRQGGSGSFSERFSTASTLLLSAYFLFLSFYNFQYIGFAAAVLVALLIRVGLLSYLPGVLDSGVVRGVEKWLRPVQFLFYFSRRTETEITSFYAPPEQISIQSKKEGGTTIGSDMGAASEDAEGEDSNSDELSKSRYDEVDVKDYVLEPRKESTAHHEQESFEI